MTRVAAIDCGTNSIRLLVADIAEAGATLTDVVRRMEIVRLGQGVDRTGRLSPEAIERTRVALVDYTAQIRALGAEKVRMVATSATRDAANAEEFRSMVLETLGAAPEVVTGDEEARLSFTGAVRGLPADTPRPYLVVDIGGGSTEFVLGATEWGDCEPSAATSVDIGCVRMTERYLRDDPPTAAQIEAAEAHITEVTDAALAAVGGHDARTLIGLAGSVTTVTALALALDRYRPERIHHARVSYAEVARVTGELLTMTHAQRLTLPVMHPGRADVIGAGALVLRIVMDRARIDSVVASEHDILDGIAYSVASRT
jgi:exopolyphosphatase/guanosine-5'-triphosphate,3'-diphosphate pyrophosphatase